MIRFFASSILVLAAPAFGQLEMPNITNVTNAALPSLDQPPASLNISPRSMITIFGTGLADSTGSAIPPWPITLGGTEVHLASDTCFEVSCEIAAGLVYASPTQINLVVPDLPVPSAYRVVFFKNGIRMDNQGAMRGGPGRVITNRDSADVDVVFQVGYDCLFSFSLIDPGSCGVSWSQGQHRAPLGAITDAATGTLISSQAPVHQGQIVTVWLTAISGSLAMNTQSGLMEAPLSPLNFGLARSGNDLSGVVDFGLTDDPYARFGVLQTTKPIWAGESHEIVGLDQINVAFPACNGKSAATAEERYDAFLNYTNPATKATVRLYLPFLIRPGDADCQWDSGITPTTTALTSSVNPSAPKQSVTLTATVLPGTATGSVTFLDGKHALGTAILSAGKATYNTSGLTVGTHSLAASYNGDRTHPGSTSAQIVQTVWTISLSSSPNPSASGQSVTFSACNLPKGLSGFLVFLDGTTTIGVINSITSPCSTFSTSGLPVGTHSITVHYSDTSNTNDSPSIVQTVNEAPKAPTTITVTSNGNPAQYYPGGYGAIVAFTATVSPSSATGRVNFYMVNPSLICASDKCEIPCYTHSSVGAPNAICYYYFAAGTSAITAVYTGDNNFSASTSPPFMQTVNLSLTSNPNPSTVGQAVTFTTDGSVGTGVMTFYDGTTRIGTSVVSHGQAAFSTSSLSVGTHSITAVFKADPLGADSTSRILTQTVKAQ